jgi:hypothetical protein
MKMNNDLKTTLVGGAAGLAALGQVDVTKLIAGDPAEIAKVAFGVLVMVLGFFTNRKAKA